MKILIATIGFGSGHNRAAHALAETIRRDYPETELRIIDFLSWEKSFHERLIEFIYLHAIKYFPSAYRFFYRRVPSSPILSSVVNEIVFAPFTRKMERFLRSFPADLIISTHVYCARASCSLKPKFSEVKSIWGVVTDFMDERYWSTFRLDRFFVPTRELKEKLIAKGIGEERITVSAMPVSEKFHAKKDRAKACKEIDNALDPRKYTALLLGGGNGLGEVFKAAKALIELPIQVLAVAGINSKLKKNLDKLKQGRKNLFVFGYTDNMHGLMDASDICVTKPGGMTIAECRAKGLEIVIYGNPLPGPEAQNIDYLVKYFNAERFHTPKDLKQGIANRIKKQHK